MMTRDEIITVLRSWNTGSETDPIFAGWDALLEKVAAHQKQFDELRSETDPVKYQGLRYNMASALDRGIRDRYPLDWRKPKTQETLEAAADGIIRAASWHQSEVHHLNNCLCVIMPSVTFVTPQRYKPAMPDEVVLGPWYVGISMAGGGWAYPLIQNAPGHPGCNGSPGRCHPHGGTSSFLANMCWGTFEAELGQHLISGDTAMILDVSWRLLSCSGPSFWSHMSPWFPPLVECPRCKQHRAPRMGQINCWNCGRFVACLECAQATPYVPGRRNYCPECLAQARRCRRCFGTAPVRYRRYDALGDKKNHLYCGPCALVIDPTKPLT